MAIVQKYQRWFFVILVIIMSAWSVGSLAYYHEFSHERNQQLAYMSLNVGILLSVLFLNGILYMLFYEIKYMLHMLFIYSLMNYLAIVSGLLSLVYTIPTVNLLGFWSYLIYMTAIMFVYKLLDIQREGRWVSLAFIGLSIASAIGSLLALIYPESQILRNFCHYYGITVAIILMSVGYYKINSGFKVSRYYMIALYLLGSSAVMLMLHRIGTLSSEMTENIIFATASMEAILFTVGIAESLIEAQKSNSELVMISTTDKLTGLKNRHYFDIVYPSIENESTRYQKIFTVIIFDIDHFKKVNDTYGHDQGDKILIRTAELVNQICRKPDVQIRWGGEEFLVLLPQTNLEGGILLAEKLRSAIESDDFYGICSVTCSFGVAERRLNESFELLYKRSDKALYKAKQEGRNKVVPCFEEEISPFGELNAIFRWLSSYECGNQLIDLQHQTMLERMNKLMSLVQTSPEISILAELNSLIALIEAHFTDEENLLKDIGYLKSEEHRIIHQKLLKEALFIKENFKQGKVSIEKLYGFFYGEIIMGHLVAEDFGYFKYVSSSSNGN